MFNNQLAKVLQLLIIGYYELLQSIPSAPLDGPHLD